MVIGTESADQHQQGKLVEAVEVMEAEDLDRDVGSTLSISSSSRVTSHRVPSSSSKGSSSSSCRANPVSSSSIHLVSSSSNSPDCRPRHTSQRDSFRQSTASPHPSLSYTY